MKAKGSWWSKRKQDKRPGWKQHSRPELRLIFVQLVESAAKFSGNNEYEAAIANIGGAAARVIVAAIDRELSDAHLADAFAAWAATAPLTERLSALQQVALMPNPAHAPRWPLAGANEPAGCTCGFRCTTQSPDTEIAEHIALAMAAGRT